MATLRMTNDMDCIDIGQFLSLRSLKSLQFCVFGNYLHGRAFPNS